MHLDAPTIAFAGFVTGIGIAIGFTLLLLVLRGQPVLRLWVGSLWLLTLGALLLGLRNQIPDGLSILGGNAAVTLSNALLLKGIAAHVQRPCRWRLLLVPSALFLALIAWFTFAQPDLRARIALFNLQAIVWDASAILLLLRYGQREIRTSCRLAAAAFAFDGAFYLARPLIPTPGMSEDIMRAQSLVVASDLVAILVTLSTSFALLLLVTERLMVNLHRMARLDGLTALPNRGAILAEGERHLAGCRRRGAPLTLLLFDLDHFKQINDTWGHEAGDAVLKHFAQAIGGDLSWPGALFGRYGGEEFVLVLPGMGGTQAHALADELRATLARTPVPVGEHGIPVTTSIGLAEAVVGESFEQLVAKADAALYRAKAAGRNRVGGAMPENA